jgi:uncharacterized protein (TIGR03905 family)
MFEYNTAGVCPSRIFFEIDDDGNVRSIRFDGGCSGNLKALSRLCEGQSAKAVIKTLKGIECGTKPTSCGDQFAKALERALDGRLAG